MMLSTIRIRKALMAALSPNLSSKYMCCANPVVQRQERKEPTAMK